MLAPCRSSNGLRPALNLSSILAISITLFLTACGGSTGSNGGGGITPAPTPTPSTANEWTWMSGSNTANAPGVYGTLGVAAASNVPGARGDAVSVTDSSGNLWLFGGDSGNSSFNDLWKFSPATNEWTWVSGSDTANAVGVYGTQGVASTSTTCQERGQAHSAGQTLAGIYGSSAALVTIRRERVAHSTISGNSTPQQRNGRG